MIYGPFDPTSVDKITKLLTQHGISFKVQFDHVHSQRSHQDKNASPHPQERIVHVGTWGSLYLEIPDEETPKIPSQLEHYGLVPVHIDEDEPSELKEQYYCTRCDYHSDHEGFCPSHRERLVSFDQFMQLQRQKEQHLLRASRVVLAIVGLVITITYIFISYF